MAQDEIPDQIAAFDQAARAASDIARLSRAYQRALCQAGSVQIP